MALTRKMLAAMEIDGDKVTQIIDAHAETVAALQDEIDKAKAEAETLRAQADKLKDVQKKLDDLKAQVKADAKEREGKDYDALKKEFDDYKADQAAKAARASKEKAYAAILKDAGIPEKHFAKIIKYSDVDGIELTEKGEAKDAKEILEAIKEEWGDHVERTQTQGAETQKPPSNTGGSGKTKEEIMKVKSAAERQRLIAENPELFGLGRKE